MSHLAQTRDLLVKQRSALKAKINNLLSAEAINLKREALSSNTALEQVLTMPLSPRMLAETPAEAWPTSPCAQTPGSHLSHP